MSKLGSQNNPLILNDRDPLRAEKIAHICTENDWYFILECNVTKPEDIRDFEKKVNPPTLQYEDPKFRRNGPCPCGSGKKYKKCCINSDVYVTQVNP
ncbi:MAG: PBPRA1643 family SWIM/SEC-C metal-binding motif protein [Pseudobdellovibrionaceae bacterium]